MKKDNRVYINQILDSVAKIEQFVSGIERGTFEKDQKTQSAVIMQQKIDLPWKDIVGFRDIAIHNYFEVDIDIVWATIIEDLPKVKEALKQF